GAVEGRVDADHAEALRFLLRRGFFELNRLERVRLDLPGEELPESTPDGIELVPLAVAQDPDSLRALHAVLTAAFRERPMRYLEPFTEKPLEQLATELSRAHADGSFVARAGGEIVGFSGPIAGPQPGPLTAFMTPAPPD